MKVLPFLYRHSQFHRACFHISLVVLEIVLDFLRAVIQQNSRKKGASHHSVIHFTNTGEIRKPDMPILMDHEANDNTDLSQLAASPFDNVTGCIDVDSLIISKRHIVAFGFPSNLDRRKLPVNTPARIA